MGHSQAGKTQSHDRIVKIAAKRFREAGLDGLAIADLMQEAGLTHGAFYKHFTSRDDLVLQGLAAALADRQFYPVPKDSIGLSFAEIVKGYLSEKHRAAPGIGCAVAALVNDLGRANGDAKDLYTAHVRHRIENTAARSSGADAKKKRKQAIVAVSAMAGALGLARAVSDKRLSDEILRTVREYLLEAFSPAS